MKLYCLNAIFSEGKTDGNWSPWGPWSICPKGCTKDGGTLVKRYRQCNMPPPMFGGKQCEGSATEEVIGCINVCPGRIKNL